MPTQTTDSQSELPIYINDGMAQVALIEQEDAITKPVKNQGSHIGCGLYLQILRIIFRIMLEEDSPPFPRS